MELVEGPTLDERLKAGVLSLEECLSIARQIAEALEEAHEKGIVHRDLKPQNVKAPVDGKVKVLDFGLAKAMDPPGASSAADLARSPTIMNSPTMTAAHGTQLGVILGTAAYMSPEQARGGAVDKRADIWAFGVVLFEMLSGRSLFAADTVSDTLAGVLKTEIDFGALPATTPPPSASSSAAASSAARRTASTTSPTPGSSSTTSLAGRVGDEARETAPPPARRNARATAAWVAALVAVGAAAALAGFLASRRGATPAEPLRLSIPLAPDQELLVGANSTLAFSPDGGSLVFTGRSGGRQSLFRRDLGRARGRADSRHRRRGLGLLLSRRTLDRLRLGRSADEGRLRGGAPVPARRTRGRRRLHLASRRHDRLRPGLLRRTLPGLGRRGKNGAPDDSRQGGGRAGHWWPAPLPGERQVVFTAFRTPVDTSRIGVLDLATRKVKWVVEGGFFGRYVSTGHLLYARGQRLYAVPFDAATATVKGAAVAVLDDVLVSQTSGFAMAAVSSRGMLAYVAESLGNPLRELVWLDRTGRASPAIGERRRFLSASLSPDDRQIALTVLGESRDLWTYSLERRTLSRLTSGEGTEFGPVWSRDGRELFYVVDRPPFELCRIAVGAPDTGRPIWDETTKFDTTGPAVSPDGRTIAFSLAELQTSTNLYVRPLDGNSPPRPIRATRSEEKNASFSPDGSWVVYQSNETGRPEIYAQPFPGPGGPGPGLVRRRHGPPLGEEREIFYDVTATTSWSSPRRLSGRVERSAPRVLFTFPILPGSSNDSQTYDVTRDGARVLAVTIPEGARPRRVVIVTNWDARPRAHLARRRDG